MCVLGAHEGPMMVLDSWDLQLEVVMCAEMQVLSKSSKCS